MTKLKVTQVRSVIHRPKDQKQTVRRLGLHRIRHSVIKDDRPEIRGMISKVQHLVRVEEVPGDASGDVKDERGGRGRDIARERTTS
jgi:large subunit ribosomal protein L30